MGINNIHVLIEPDLEYRDQRMLELQVRAAREEELTRAHRRGEHPWGRMRRECPLCPDS